MSIEGIERMPAVAPLDFFAIETVIPFTATPPSLHWMRTHALLPDTSEWLGEERFADVALAWNEEGIFVNVCVQKAFEAVSFPSYSEGDAFELFLDTRDLKSAGFATRFCHHFLLLPQSVQGVQFQELTHFRTEDTHQLCDPTDVSFSCSFERRSYEMALFIPRHVLCGYDPSNFPRLGGTYCLHRSQGSPQHFALSSRHVCLAQNPRLWASFHLGKETERISKCGLGKTSI